MISYLRGPGGFRRRAFAEAVPFWLASLVAGTVMAVLSPVLTIVAWLAAWVGFSLFLRWVRTKDRLRRIYRIALGLHVAFWSLLGILHSYPSAAGELRAPTVHDWGRATRFKVGVGTSVFDLPARTTLAGWGQAPRRIRVPPFGGFGVIGRMGQAWMGAVTDGEGPRLPLFRTADNVTSHDLAARAMVIVPEELEGAAPVAFLSLDLVTLERALADEVVKRLAPLGFLPETVTVSATHTHSGPGGYSKQPLSALVGTDHFDPVVFERIVMAAVSAVTAAHGSVKPGRLVYTEGRDRDPYSGEPVVARNRRAADPNEIDDRIRLLRGDLDKRNILDPHDLSPVGVLVNYAVHPILNRRRSTALSQDLAGDIRGAFVRNDAADEVLFVNSAAADISPRHAIARRTDRGRALARGLRQAVREAPELAASRVRVRAARVTREFGTPHAVFGVGDREAMIEAAEGGMFSGGIGGFFADLVALPVNAVIWSSGITEARVAFRFSGSAAAIANLELAVTENEHAFGAIVIQFESGAPRRVPILWAPAEATQALGKHWRATIADGFLFGYTNGVMGYVTTDAEYGIESYEARTTLYGRNTGEMAGEALKAAYEAALSSDADR